jgi:non-ribosomal peptide synthetase component F/aryl carrier-like protein
VAGAGSGAEGSPEAALRRQVGEALGIPPDRLPLDRPLVTLGLDSLAAVRLHHLLPAGSGAGVSPVHLLADCTLADLLARAGAGGPPPASREAPPPATDEEGVPAPLSHGQKSLWFLQRLAPGRTAYNVVVAARVLQGLDAEALRRAVARLIDRHPALRTTFVEQAGEPWQVVGSAVGEDPVRVEDWDGTAERLRERLEAEAGRPFDLESGPLLRVLVWRLHRESVLQLIVQHIAVDFWSLSILAGDLGALYAAEVAGTPAPAPLPRATYLDFVRWQRRLLASERGERLRAYWEGALTPLPPALALPTDRPRGPVQSFAGDAHTFALDAALTERVRALAAGRGMTAYTVLLAAFQTLLARLSGATSLVIGSPAAGRGDAAFAETVGYFVNPVVLRADLGGDPTFEAFLGRTQAVALAALEHQDYPFLLLAERLEGGREPGRPPVFQVMFTLQKARLPREAALAAFACGQEGVRISLGGLELESMSCRERTAQTDLSLALAEVAGRLCGQLRYATGLFDGATAQRLARGFRTLLAGALAAPGRRVSELPLLAEEERRQVLRQGRRRTSVWPPPGVPALMAAAARRSPDAVAVEGLAGALLRYGELAGRSGRVAAGLRAAGVGPEILVGVALERSPDLLVALLGVLRAGGACLLLDPLDERAGLERMLELSGCRVLLTRGRLAGRLPEHGAMEIHLERLEESARDEEDGWREIDPDGLAFVVRTAGGRRQPRLVCLTHRSLAAWLESWAGRLGPEDLRAVTGEGAAGTIDGLFDLLLPVCLGGRAVLDPALARPSLRSATPTRWAVELRAGTAAGTRVLRSSGEVLTEGLRTRLLAAGARAVYDSFASALGGVWPSASSADVYVLDRSGEPVPAGVAGDLWLGGAGLARGYLADPEETARRFRPDPFGGLPGARLAFTGDRARWRSDGRLEILGAAREVEAGGRRFDPGLVEEVLAAHPRVLRAVAGVQREGEGARLVAHVLGAGPAGPPAAELREYLRGRLPETQVPWTFAILDELPRTPAGRIDTRALPRIAPLEPLEGAAPRTEIERMLVEIWRELLQIDRVGIHDNFFQLGGNSLLATQAVVRMNQAFQLSLGVETLFRSPTVASLAMTTDEHLIAQLGEEALEFL